jgi:hypothetical protein
MGSTDKGTECFHHRRPKDVLGCREMVVVRVKEYEE